MKIVLQRVSSASVTVNRRRISRIREGLLLLVAVEKGDTEEDARYLSAKIAKMRIFPDSRGKMNRSLLDIKGEVLAVSQFTLAAEWRKGNRPSFVKAAKPEYAVQLLKHFTQNLQQQGVRSVREGAFGEHMKVSLCNNGPVTIVMSRNTTTDSPQ